MAVACDVPEAPAVAGWRTLNTSGDGMDRAAMLGRDQTAVRSHPGGPAPVAVDQHIAWAQQSALDQIAERDARCIAARVEHNGFACRRPDRGDAAARQLCIAGVTLDTDKAAAETLRHRTGRAGAKEWVEHHFARPG